MRRRRDSRPNDRRWSAIATASTLTCPKCQGAMRTYERSGVTVDQCAECRGIFLDRGELERLIDAEQAWHAGQRPPQEPSYQPRPTYQQPSYGGHGDQRQRRRKKSFFDELFDQPSFVLPRGFRASCGPHLSV